MSDPKGSHSLKAIFWIFDRVVDHDQGDIIGRHYPAMGC
jgi:hypothetical protein